ncbi:MAG TPA: SH3 domain-containing C40 family peptidase [Oscillospiraceae bacterium]|nr:SH3 domain-containing C40 family peptidase [Oscillospiraceae bacterium]
MQKALVVSTIAPLMTQPSERCERADEALCGMEVSVLGCAADGWWRVRTHYGYEGFVCARYLLLDNAAALRWAALPKMVVTKGCCDVLSEARVQGWCVAFLTRGAVVSPLGEAADGWVRVLFCDGRMGFTRESYLGELRTAWSPADEETLRRCFADTALSYLGTHYRWGGKTPLGIDCSGLVSMSYLLCGVTIWRDAKLKEGYPLREISCDRLKTGDLMFFPGHVAMYLGDGRYVHSTGKSGSDGVVLGSLDPAAPDYREDLGHGITACGSIF